MNEISYDAPRPEAVHELGQALAAQQAGSPAQTEALAQSFLARMQRDIDEQVDLRVQQQIDVRIQQYLATWKPPMPKTASNSEPNLPLALGSMGIAIPLTAIAASLGGGIWGIIIVWVGLVIINVSWSRHR